MPLQAQNNASPGDSTPKLFKISSKQKGESSSLSSGAQLTGKFRSIRPRKIQEIQSGILGPMENPHFYIFFSLGHVIRGAGSLVLGQEQDRVGGGFNADQSFVGELTGVNIWERVIHHQGIARMSKSCLTGEGNVYKWSDFKPHIIGGVQLVSRWCAS